MPPGDEQRQDPFASMGDEPVDDLATVIPSALRRPPSIGGRRTPLRPSERRRKKRMLTVTFSNVHPDIPDRIRGLAEKWGMFTAAGRPNFCPMPKRFFFRYFFIVNKKLC